MKCAIKKWIWLRRTWSLAMVWILLFSLFPAVYAADVRLSDQNLTVDGASVVCEKYNIDGSNYFKLRDIAFLLSDTRSRFSVDWDASARTVSITTGQPYTPDGSELVITQDQSDTAVESRQTIIIDGAVRDDLAAYNIGGNNYFKLRDLGSALSFSVGYDVQTRTATVASAMQMSVSRASGQLSISRPATALATDTDDTWTIFVYLCGADLESFYGMGTGDINEMLAATPSDHVRFVIETGGANAWHDDHVTAGTRQRFLVQNGEITCVDEGKESAMGLAVTLADFLRWGLQNYASGHMGLVFWDHGGGSIQGVCFDERYQSDSLSLREIDTALLRTVNQKFDFIGFDACLMGTMETANILASYAQYMIASEELEPGAGWDYTAIGTALAENPGVNGEALGKIVCDSYLAACIRADDSDMATLAVTDLSKMDQLLLAFHNFAKNLYAVSDSTATCANIVRGITAAENFGGNNRTEGYTNMVDLGGILTASAPYVEGADAALAALDDAVCYKVSGGMHTEAQGLSLYYPLSVQNTAELTTFSDICTSPYYVSFVDRQNQRCVSGTDTGAYDDGQWYDDEGDWSWSEEEGADSDNWQYADDYEAEGESPYITFSQKPAVDADGNLCFVLDEAGLSHTADVTGIVYQVYDGTCIEIGSTWDIYADWETGTFADCFDGYWMSLADGQNLQVEIIGEDEQYIYYTSPILLNGEETNLRLRRARSDGSVYIEGTWDGIADTGASDRVFSKLQAGDVILPRYSAFVIDTLEETEYNGAEYVFQGESEIFFDTMEPGDYLYAFCIDDIYGDYYLTDFVHFALAENGEISFYEDEDV